MSISSVAAPAPVSMPDTSAPKAPDVANNNNTDDAGASSYAGLTRRVSIQLRESAFCEEDGLPGQARQ